MKNLLKLIFILTVVSSCTPEDLVNDPESTNTPKINIVKLIKNGDTTAYTFQYNADTTRLNSVLRDGDLYASLTYRSNEVLLAMAMNTNFTDSFVAKLSPANYIDSLKNPQLAFFGLGDPVSITRGVNNKLFESRNYLNEYIKREGIFSGYTKQETYTSNSEYSSPSNNLIKYNAQASQSIFSENYRDTLSYTLPINQPNLPDQFVTNIQSYFLFQGKPILTPLFLLQQSNIYPYRTHTNLVYTRNTSEFTFFVYPSFTKTDYYYTYNYTFDGRSRVTQMDVNLDGANYLTYQFVYFD